MANKLKVNKKKTSSSRYFKGLSVAEMDDVEQSVEEALENPAGTFTIVTQELNFRLSNMQKSIKTIGVDTKYIRKAIDKLDKKLDDIGSGGSGFNLGDILGTGAAAHGGWGALKGLFGRGASSAAGPATAASKRAIGLKSLSNLSKLGKAAGASFGGAVNMMGPSMILDAFDDKVLAELEPKLQNSRDLRKQYGDEIFAAARKKYQPWWRWSSIDTEDSRDGEYIQSYLNDLKRTEKTTNVKRKINISAPTIINNVNSSVSNTGFKELSPTERAKIIAERLKLMTQVPGMMGGGMAPGVLDGLSGMTPDWPTGSGGGGSSGGGRGGGGGGGWGDDSPAKPQLPSLTPSEFMALEKSGLAGTRDNSYKVLPTTPGQYRPVYAGIENDIKNRDLINIIGNEARRTNESTDAVINNMMNRLGSKNYGNAQTLTQVAKQKGQYESWDLLQIGRFRPVDEARAKHIEERLRLIASGQAPDTTGGANEFRASSYVFGRGRGKPFARLAERQGNRNLGGNVYANTGYEPGPYAAYTPEQIEANKRMIKPGQKIDPMAVVQNTNPLVNSAHQVPSATVVTNAEKPSGKLFKNSHLANGGPMPNASDVASKVASATPSASVFDEKTSNKTDYASIMKRYDLHPERPNSIDGIKPEMQARVGAMLRDAPDYVKKELRIVSGHRDQDRQNALYAASGGSGMVAKNSKHTRGTAVDFGVAGANSAGAGWSKLSPEVKNWVIANAAKYGLYQPLQPGRTSIREDWHFEPIGNRSGMPNQPVADVSAWKDPGLSQPVTVAAKQATVVSPPVKETKVAEPPPPQPKVIYANAEVKPPMNKSEQVKTSNTNFLEDRTKTQSAPGKGNMEPTLAEKQAKLKEEHRRYILDKNSDPKPPVQKTYDKTPFKERFPNFSTAADPNFGAKKITPENNPTDVAMEMAKKALEESVKTANAAVAHDKELIKNVVATPPPKLPQSSANKPPLANLPKTAKKGVSNPTDKAPGTDSAKTNTAPPLEDLLPQGGQYFP